MTNPLYTTSYLEKTADVLKDFKMHSYTPFLNIKEGLIADIGCGTGFDVLQLAKLIPDRTKVIGLDIDPEMIAFAQAQNADNQFIEFKVSEADSLPFENDSISGLRNERLIQHLIDPPLAFEEFYRVLKKGGPLVVAETDWDSFCMYNGDFSIRQKLKNFLVERHVASGNAAKKLITYLQNSEFSKIELDIFPFVSPSLAQTIEMLKIDRALDKMMEAAIISQQEQHDFLTQLKKEDSENCFSCSINLIIAKAVK